MRPDPELEVLLCEEERIEARGTGRNSMMTVEHLYWVHVSAKLDPGLPTPYPTTFQEVARA